MRILTALLGLLLPAASLAAKSKASDAVFQQYNKKGLSSVPIELDDRSFADLSTTPRDYGFVACLTALGAQFGCGICQTFDPEWKTLGKSWKKADKQGEKRMVFGTLDFTNGRQTFQSLGLDTAPVVVYYPPTTGPHAPASGNAGPIKYDFTTGAPTADMIQGWLSRHLADTVPPPKISRPINYLRIATFTTIILGLITLCFVAWPYISPLIQSRNLWAALSSVAILLFTSGHMYNHIRGTPYIAGDGKGGVSYFAPGFQNQYGMESQVIAGMYGILSFATISLAVKVPRIQDRKIQQTAVFAWLGVTYLTYAFLMSIFRVKNGGYPYSLPPF